MKNKTPKWLPILLIFILGVTWGLHFSIIKIASESDLPYGGIAALTTLGVSILFTSICIIRKRLPIFNKASVRFYILCGLLGYVIPLFTELYVASKIPAGLLSLVVSMTPLFVITIAHFKGTERIGRKRMMGIFFGLASVAVIVLPENALPKAEMMQWVAITLILPIAYGIYHNYVAISWPSKSDSWQVATGESLAALIMLLPFYIWSGDFIALNGTWGNGEWSIILLICLSVAEIYLYFEIVRLAGAVFVSQSSYIAIVTGIIWGVIIFNERLSVWVWCSVGLLFVALHFAAQTNQQNISVKKLES